jgi:hypothetical protein
LEILKETDLRILGGDILSENNGELAYAMDFWGIYLDWSCDKKDDETEEQYLKRCYGVAKESIYKANDIAKELNKKCYIVLVVSTERARKNFGF